MADDNGFLNLNIDEAVRMLEELKQAHTKQSYQRLMYRVFKRTGDKVKTIIKREVPKKYRVKAGWVGQQIGAPQLENGETVRCSIPLKGTRGTIGGVFQAGKRLARLPKGTKKGIRRVRAALLKGQWSVIPSRLGNQGNAIPFLIQGRAYARRQDTKKTVRVVGLNLPRMPFNKPRAEIEAEILKTMKERIEHEHQRLMKGK